MIKHTVTAENAPKIHQWFAERGGIAVWASINLSNPGASWTTPATDPVGAPATKPTWEAESTPTLITDPADVEVVVPKEVKRFRVGVRVSNGGLQLKVTDAGTRKIRAAVAKAGDDAWHEFDYDTQEAVIYVPGSKVPLPDWMGART